MNTLLQENAMWSPTRLLMEDYYNLFPDHVDKINSVSLEIHVDYFLVPNCN